MFKNLLMKEISCVVFCMKLEDSLTYLQTSMPNHPTNFWVLLSSGDNFKNFKGTGPVVYNFNFRR